MNNNTELFAGINTGVGKLSFVEFSRILLETGDIDPDYAFMRRIAKQQKMEQYELFNWIFHKLVIYDSVSELEVMYGHSKLDNCKYGNERRKHKHNAKKYLFNISTSFSFKWLELPAQELFNQITNVVGFGPWSAWKMMDLLNCVAGYPIDFNGIDFRKSYEFPLKGLLMVNGLPEDLTQFKDNGVYNACISTAKSALTALGNLVPSPHNNNKGVRMNEIETLLCKYHSYCHGHYSPGKDTEHLNHRIKESSLKWLI